MTVERRSSYLREHAGSPFGGTTCATIRRVPIDALTAYAHVTDVERSVEFYRRLGLEVQSSYESEGKLVWALVARPGDAPDDAGHG